jgi:nitrate/TMAO reductase-like tetraheme cytochrome c subunit
MLTTALVVLSLLMAVLFVLRPQLGLSNGGRVLAFVGLCAVPVMVGFAGLDFHMEEAKSTEFCTSCHVMEKHGRSLRVDDDTLLAAAHFQGGRVPRERACFACHTTYTMYGDFTAKLRGLRHVWVNYLGKTPEEGKIKTYDKYNNRECLHCHEGTRKYLNGATHKLEAGRFEKMRKNEASCIASGCHEFIHAISDVDSLPLWAPKEGGTK